MKQILSLLLLHKPWFAELWGEYSLADRAGMTSISINFDNTKSIYLGCISANLVFSKIQ